MDGSHSTFVSPSPANSALARTLRQPAPLPKMGRLGRRAAFASPLILLIVWSALSYSGLFPKEIVVPPDGIWRAFISQWSSGELPKNLLGSLQRLAVGYGVGAGLGIVLGVLMGASKQAEAYLMPAFQTLRQLPTIALIPAFIMIFGVGETVKIVLVAKATALPVTLGAFQGVRGVPSRWFEVARLFRIPAPVVATKVILPAILPSLFQGLRIALSHAWVVLVGAELLIADNGIGQMMEWGRQTFRLDIVLVGVVLTGLIGFLLDKGFRLLERGLKGRGA